MGGRFISLEGGEGVGKSTQVARLAEALRERGIDVVVTREPGGSPGGEAIRQLLLGGSEDRWGARAEALLFAAARADHVEKRIRPALAAGQWVICDRFVDSSMAYQGGAGGLGMAAIRALHDFGSEGFLPDRTLVLEAQEGVARARLRDGGQGDRIGARSSGYHAAVADAFRAIAKDEPERVRRIDASQPVDEVAQAVMDAMADLLP